MDTLANRTEARRVAALGELNSKTQAQLGQFFTPEAAARLIAQMPRLPETGVLRILDPGAGVGSLGAALVDRILDETSDVEVELVAVEVDPDVETYLTETLADCVATASARGRTVRTQAICGDYILLSAFADLAGGPLGEPFDIVIMNPPYAKLPVRSAHRRTLAKQGVECSNLYAAFMAIGVAALRTGGQIVAITPRSFANGPYFEQFRKYILKLVAVNRLHIFESRSTVFSDTGVLQENIVISATRDGERSTVELTASRGHLDAVVDRVVEYSELVKDSDPHKFLRIVSNDEDIRVAALMSELPCNLAQLGVTVSTGKVVDFRAKPNLSSSTTVDEHRVPLIYPGNVRGGVIEWPRAIRKPTCFEVLSSADEKLLVPSGHFVVVKRFSSKEEARRLVAAVWDPTVNGSTRVAFENHLNILHHNGGGLDRALAIGLSLWLNSSFVDKFFRTFSGHTQVNATDLRSMRFPTLENLRALGDSNPMTLPSQSDIDALVEHITGKELAQ